MIFGSDVGLVDEAFTLPNALDRSGVLWFNRLKTEYDEALKAQATTEVRDRMNRLGAEPLP